ncbi:MAG: APC family permease [Candidatus Aenigmarchaeota archaeon]|nr:APC family permease [Candidatus Aenigmarchaeota archaeon]
MKRVSRSRQARPKHRPMLKRELGLLGAVVYGIGIIFGAGIYVLISPAAGMAGNALWLSFLVAATTASLTGMSYMELISMFPKSAAEYIYVKNAFHSRLPAFNVGWVEIFTDVIATAAVSLGFAGYFSVLTGFPAVPVALCLIALMSLVNFLGIGQSSKLNFALSGIALGGLVFLIISAFTLGRDRLLTADYFEMPNGLTGVLGAASLIFFAYIGFEELANLSEETKDARRIVPRALLISVVITTAVYMLISVAVIGLVGWQALSASSAPLALVASSMFGPNAFLLMSILALFTTASTVLVGLIVSSRVLYGMSRDGALPKVLSTVDMRRCTPWVAILTSMLLAMSFVLIERIDIVASVTDMGTFYMFAFVNLAALLLRCAPLNIGRFPLVPFFGLVTSLILASQLNPLSIAIGGVIVIAGVVVYFVFIKKKAEKIF